MLALLPTDQRGDYRPISLLPPGLWHIDYITTIKVVPKMDRTPGGPE